MRISSLKCTRIIASRLTVNTLIISAVVIIISINSISVVKKSLKHRRPPLVLDYLRVTARRGHRCWLKYALTDKINVVSVFLEMLRILVRLITSRWKLLRPKCRLWPGRNIPSLQLFSSSKIPDYQSIYSSLDINFFFGVPWIFFKFKTNIISSRGGKHDIPKGRIFARREPLSTRYYASRRYKPLEAYAGQACPRPSFARSFAVVHVFMHFQPTAAASWLYTYT